MYRVSTLVSAALLGLAAALPASAAEDAAFPAPIEVRAPYEPTAFPNAGRAHLLYELYLTNFGSAPVSLQRVDILDADQPGAKPVASFAGKPLDEMVQGIGVRAPTDPTSGLRQIAPGSSIVVFMSLDLEPGARLPARLSHHIVTDGPPVDAAVIGTHGAELRVLGPPMQGPGWLAGDGPSNEPDNHHRRGFLAMDGRVVTSRRFAIDWQKVAAGHASYSGDATDVHAYPSYGEPLLAVADARVAFARDGLPDNKPGHGKDFHPAVPITLDTTPGNTVTLDLGNGQYAYYMHMRPGSLTVRTGDRVRRGQMIGRIGASGDAREPHLHFEVTTSPKLLAGEGLPYVIDRYRGEGGEPVVRSLPLNNTVIDFTR